MSLQDPHNRTVLIDKNFVTHIQNRSCHPAAHSQGMADVHPFISNDSTVIKHSSVIPF